MYRSFVFLCICWVVRKLSQHPACVEAVGYDGAEHMIEKAKEADFINAYHCAKFPETKPDKTYQFVHSMEFLYYLKDPKNMLQSIHDDWLEELVKNNFIDKRTKKKVPKETLELLKIQKDMMVKQLIKYPELYYAKSHFPLEISQRAFDHLWRVCESYELWCKETKQTKLMILKIID